MEMRKESLKEHGCDAECSGDAYLVPLSYGEIGSVESDVTKVRHLLTETCYAPNDIVESPADMLAPTIHVRASPLA
jgi:hypothetical protein